MFGVLKILLYKYFFFNYNRIRHFAGPVTYSTGDLVAKNTDSLPRHISAMLHHHSRLSIVQSLFPEGRQNNCSSRSSTGNLNNAQFASPAATAPPPPPSTTTTTSTTASPTSLAATLRTQLSTLLQLIAPRKTHYVFCLTPSARRHGTGTFDVPLVQHQVRYHSLLPLVRLWRTGHCYSIAHQRFVQRYKLLNVATWPHVARDLSTVAAVARIVQGLPLPGAEFTIGIRRVLVRSPRTVHELEGFRRARLHDLACLVQTIWRGWRRRRWFVRQRSSQMVIASAWRTWRVSDVV